MRLLLLAPPGAGKGTQGQRLAAWLGVRHIAAGDLLRAQARAGGALGQQITAYQARGDLVPDQIVLDVLIPAVVEAAAEGGYILDGFPRTLAQATAAAELAVRLGVTLDAAVYLHAPEAVLTRRLLDRASQGGRSDDKADVIRHRLQVFAETTGLLVPYYTERGILVTVDADQPPDSVTADIQSRLSGLSLPGGAHLRRHRSVKIVALGGRARESGLDLIAALHRRRRRSRVGAQRSGRAQGRGFWPAARAARADRRAGRR